MISVKGASFGRFGGWRRRYPGGSECRSIFLTVSRAMPNRLAASRWLRPSTWQASRTRRYRSTVYILPPSISKKIEGYRWQSFTPPAAGKSRRFRGLICHRRSQRPAHPARGRGRRPGHGRRPRRAHRRHPHRRPASCLSGRHGRRGNDAVYSRFSSSGGGSRTSISGCSVTSSAGTNAIRMPHPA